MGLLSPSTTSHIIFHCCSLWNWFEVKISMGNRPCRGFFQIWCLELIRDKKFLEISGFQDILSRPMAFLDFFPFSES